MSKVLFVDVWEKGYRNFLRLNDSFLSLNHETLLVHTGSFMSSSKQEKQKMIDSMLVRDISYYDTILIEKVIETEKPSVVVILNLSFIFDRAIVNICKKRSIKVVYLSHGKLIDPDIYEETKNQLDAAVQGKMQRILKRKNLFFLLNYINSSSGSKITNFIRIVRGIVKNPSHYLTFAPYCKELDADLLLVYNNSDKVHLVNNMHFPDDKIKVVGNPEISQFSCNPVIDRETFLQRLDMQQNDKYYLYLDLGLYTHKLWSVEEWYEHLLEMSNAIIKGGMKFLVKLHPRVNLQDHTAFFETNKSIVPLVDVDFKNLLIHSEGTISMGSSTVVYALMYNKRVLVPKWGLAEKLLNNYPEGVVCYCENLDLFIKNLEYSVNENEIKNYLKINDVNAEFDSVKCIVNYIDDLV